MVKASTITEIVFLVVVIAAILTLGGPLLLNWFYPAHSCPEISTTANRTVILNWINSTASPYETVRECALFAVSYYNSTGLLKSYNITLGPSVQAAFASATEMYYLVDYGIPIVISVVLVAIYLLLKLRKKNKA